MTGPLTAAERTVLQKRLAEAEEQLHRARMGKATSRIRHGDKDHTFVAVSASDLMSYIASLKGQLGLPTGRQAAQNVRFG